jgi:SAM-dependent methyltransferase
MRYYLAAAALRLLSASDATRKTYRRVGNMRRARSIVLERTRWVWEQAANESLKPGSRLLELGTGWTHANSLYVGLLADANICAFDVWDNRSLESIKFQVPLVCQFIESHSDHTSLDKLRARSRADIIARAASFDEVYDVIHCSYQTNASGVPLYPEATFDLIYSVDVLEHVNRESFASMASKWLGLLKPGGRFVAQVGLDDHLAHYDAGKSPKHYIQHSEYLWRTLLENDLQYINRLTASEIRGSLEKAGFLIECIDAQRCDISGLKIHPDYRRQSLEDLSTVRLIIRARRGA